MPQGYRARPPAPESLAGCHPCCGTALRGRRPSGPAPVPLFGYRGPAGGGAPASAAVLRPLVVGHLAGVLRLVLGASGFGPVASKGTYQM